MPRPKTSSYFPQSHIPRGLGLSARDKDGVLTSALSLEIERLLAERQFRIGLPRFEEPGFKFIAFTLARLDQLLEGLEAAIDMRDADKLGPDFAKHQSCVSDLQKAAAEFDAAIKAYIKASPEAIDLERSQRMAAFFGLESVEQLTAYRRRLKAIARDDASILIGGTRSVKSTSPRTRFCTALLQIYVDAGGHLTKTKAKYKGDGVVNVGVGFVIDVCTLLQDVDFIPHDVLCLNDATAEREVIAFVNRKLLKGK